MIKECEVMKEKDSQWPPPGSSGGIEELEIRMGPEKIVFEVSQLAKKKNKTKKIIKHTDHTIIDKADPDIIRYPEKPGS